MYVRAAVPPDARTVIQASLQGKRRIYVPCIFLHDDRVRAFDLAVALGLRDCPSDLDLEEHVHTHAACMTDRAGAASGSWVMTIFDLTALLLIG